MFLDIGWSEMLVIAVVAFIVLGPKELPNVLRTVASLAAKARAASRVFQQQLDEVMREANAADLRRQVDDALRVDPDALGKMMDPKGDVNRVWNEAAEVKESTALTPPPEAQPVVSAPSDATQPRVAEPPSVAPPEKGS
ncbi:MAG: Sec-independent protein translocase protein TatB [Gemmatimonas sp.]